MRSFTSTSYAILIVSKKTKGSLALSKHCSKRRAVFEFSRSHGAPLSEYFIGYFIAVVNRGIIAGTGKDRWMDR